MFQLRRNRVLVVLVLMSIFVVTTQAFSVTSEPVIVDWQYDPWGDSGLVIVTDSEVYTQVVANQVTFSFTLRNDGSNTETATVRVELVDSSGDRVAVTGQSNTNPDDDTQWLVATEQTTSAMAPANTWPSGDFTFNDGNVDSTISGGGYFVIYASTGTDMASYDITPIDRTPVLGATTLTIRPTAATDVTGGIWGTPGNAWDNNLGTATSPSTLKVTDFIYFTTWNSGTGVINQVDLNVNFEVYPFDASRADTVTVSVYVNGVVVTNPASYTTSGDVNPATTIPFTNIVEPGDGVWTWTEVTQIEVRFTGVKSGGPDGITNYNIFEVWGTVNP